MEPLKLYTYDRLSEFVDGYTEFVKKTTAEQSSPATENYKYYNFEISPDAIKSQSLGRFGSSLFLGMSNVWKPMSDSNGINAWKLNLGKKMITMKNEHNTEIINNLQPGLSYTIKHFNNIYNVTDITNLNVQSYDLLAQIAYADTTSQNNNLEPNTSCSSGYSILGNASASAPASCITPYSSILHDSVTGISNPNNEIYTPSTNTNNIVSMEWKGFFYQSTNGIYTIKFTAPSNCLFYIWLGDKSICKFLSTNADISNTKNEHTILIDNNQPVPIRIQCIFIDQTQPTFAIDISRKLMDNNGVTDQLLDVTESLHHSSIQPFAFYAAFVSSNQQQFLNNEFTCYSLVTDDNGILKQNGDLTDFYRIFRQNLPNAINLKYDYDSSNRLSYGTIPSINTQYTITESTNSVPFAYSIYHLHTDPRMGNTYQINTQMNDQTLYPMHKFGQTLADSNLSYSNDFSIKTGYYPNSSLLTQSNIGNEDGLDCKEKCVTDATCNSYYTFTSNNDPKCVISASQTPEFNRVIPANSTVSIDQNSSSLFMRNYQLDMSDTENCGTSARPSNVIPVNTTNNYSNNFEYNNYNLNSTEFQIPQQVGICGSPAYHKQQDDAYKILYNPATYFTDGNWTEPFSSNTQNSMYMSFSNNVTTPNTSNDQGESKTTQAIDDTSDAIQTNLENEEIYANKMDSISKKQSQLSRTLIPKYQQTRTTMEGNPIYDYNGNSLLYFRNKPIPQVREKRVMDNNQQYVTSQLMFSLGTLSAATLIVFAIMLARE